MYVCERCWALEKRHMREQSMWVGKHMRLLGLGSGKPHLFITEMSLYGTILYKNNNGLKWF